MDPAALAVTDVRCEHCKTRNPIRSELLLLRPGNDLPALHIFDPSEAPATGSTRLTSLMKAAGNLSDYPDVYPPVIPAERTLLPVLLQRKTVQDLSDIDGSVENVAQNYNSELAESYRRLLRRLSETVDERASHRAIYRVFSETDPRRIIVAIRDNPELGNIPSITSLRATVDTWEGDSEGAAVATARLRLAQNLADGLDPEVAAAQYLEFLDDLGGHVRTRLRAHIDAALAEGAPLGVLQKALDFAVVIGDPSEGPLSLMLGQRMASVGRTHSDLVEAQKLLARAVEMLDAADPDWAAAASSLASLLVDLPAGDPTQNWSKACELMARAVSATSVTDRPRDYAILCTNHGLLISRRPSGATLDDLTRSIELVKSGLNYRSPESNPIDWAYSHVNLGNLYQKRNQAGDFTEAETSYRDALCHLDIDDDERLWYRLRSNLASAIESRPVPNFEEAQSVLEDTLIQASARDVSPETLSDLKIRLAHVIELRSGRATPEVTQLRQDALTLLDPRIDMDAVLGLGGKLAEDYVSRGHWHAAASVFDAMLIAHDSLYRIHLDRDEQRQVLARTPTLTRWAAFAFARVGRIADAVETLEQSRARELNINTERDSINLQRLCEIDSPLAEAYQSWRSQYRLALTASTDGGANRSADQRARLIEIEQHLRRATTSIQQIPGFEDLHRRRNAAEIVNGLGGRQIVYLVSAPSGTYILSLRPSKSGTATMTARCIPEVTSILLSKLVLADLEANQPGLLLAQASDDPRVLDDALDRLHQLFPLAAALGDLDHLPIEEELVVVSAGLLGLIPLYALRISENQHDPRNLDDVRSLYLAPSASAMHTCVQRSNRVAPSHLVALANPTEDLAGAQAEVETVAALFESVGDNPTVAYNAAADRDWLLANAAAATHLHLGCHGGSEIDGHTGGYLCLSNDTYVTMDDLAAQSLKHCRVAIASACQTAHYATMGNSDEMLGLPAGLIMAGAACVVASLWPVGDYETALLMTRFYENLHLNANTAEQDPVAAMRSARLWLRQLTATDSNAYISGRPALDEALNRANITRSKTATPHPSQRPFEKPRCWAPFLVYGL